MQTCTPVRVGVPGAHLLSLPWQSAPSSFHTECAQGRKGSRTSLGSPANAPLLSSLLCSQDGELAVWHNPPGAGESPEPPVLLTLQSLTSAT